MKKQTRGWKRIMAVALAVLIAGSTVEPSALPKDSDATLTLLGNCQADAYIIGDGVTGTVTLDLAGHALIVPDDY